MPIQIPSLTAEFAVPPVPPSAPTTHNVSGDFYDDFVKEKFNSSWKGTLIECPFCSEEIKATAKKCKHCGEFIGSARATYSDINPSRKSESWNSGLAAVMSFFIQGH